MKVSIITFSSKLFDKIYLYDIQKIASKENGNKRLCKHAEEIIFLLNLKRPTRKDSHIDRHISEDMILRIHCFVWLGESLRNECRIWPPHDLVRACHLLYTMLKPQ